MLAGTETLPYIFLGRYKSAKPTYHFYKSVAINTARKDIVGFGCE